MPRRDVGLRAELSELAAMLRAYIVQETVGPLRGIGRYLLFGLLGAVAVSISVVLGALALVRVLQTETAVFGANWSFVPHLAGVAVLIVAIATMARAIRPKDGAARLATDDERFDDGATERGED
ncbi:hypothetical protein [Candidatus Poriferisodalis sp.]|uniref:hypothetical protein n=1 Tax=Candidatus Poriferisodalis sp. TaxID=3101277 RepID=UPI003B521A8A